MDSVTDKVYVVYTLVLLAVLLHQVIYWIERDDTSSMKEYNNLKHRLMKIRMKNSLCI